MISSSVKITFLIFAGVLFVVGDSPPFNPEQEKCYKIKDECAELDGKCCEGLRGGCCEKGVCVTNSTVCKVNGEQCGLKVKCSTSESCIRFQPCVCCPNCIVPILPTCEPNCGERACYRNEECISTPCGKPSCMPKKKEYV